jgi:hypothetical protein
MNTEAQARQSNPIEDPIATRLGLKKAGVPSDLMKLVVRELKESFRTPSEYELEQERCRVQIMHQFVGRPLIY